MNSAFSKLLSYYLFSLFFITSYAVSEDQIYPLVDINPGLASAFNSPYSMQLLDGVAYFFANDGVHGLELWRSDGSAAGTYLVHECIPGSAGASEGVVRVSNGKLFVFCRNAYMASSNQPNVTAWVSQSTPEQLQHTKDYFYNGLDFPLSAIPYGNGYVYINYDSILSWQAYYDDLSNTVPLYPQTQTFSSPYGFYLSGNYIYLLTGNSQAITLWKSLGTTNSTTPISLNVSSSLTSILSLPNNSTLMSAWNSSSGYEPYSIANTTGSTTLLKDIYPGSANSNISSFGILSPYSFFTASSSSSVYGLWATDGTTQGTILLKDFPITVNSQAIRSIGYDTNALYFARHSGLLDIWKTDGTTSGTVYISNLPGNLAINFRRSPVINGKIIIGRDGTNGGSYLYDTSTGAYKRISQYAGMSGEVSTLYTMVLKNGITIVANSDSGLELFGYGTPPSDLGGGNGGGNSDQCPSDPLKTSPGACGCDIQETDLDANNTTDCVQTGILSFKPTKPVYKVTKNKVTASVSIPKGFTAEFQTYTVKKTGQVSKTSKKASIFSTSISTKLGSVSKTVSLYCRMRFALINKKTISSRYTSWVKLQGGNKRKLLLQAKRVHFEIREELR